MNKPAIFVLVCFCSGIAFAGGAMLGMERGREAGPCVECCAEGEFCENEEDWAKVLMDCTHDQEAANELSKMVDACEAELTDCTIKDLPQSTKCGLKLAECRGALKECQRK